MPRRTAGSAGTDMSELIRTIRKLRRECPWDRKQTVASTRPLLLNETFELDEALRAGDGQAIAEELGDYLFMGLFLADVLASDKHINLTDVVSGIVRKLRARHPHVYGSASVRGADEVLANWERIKQRQKVGSILASIPAALPALQQAQLIQERCRRVGFDWDDPRQVLDKVAEEIGELRHELAQRRRNRPRVQDELGDLLFALVNLARHLGIDAEGALKNASRKFTARFGEVERRFAAQGRDLSGVPLEEMEAVWQQAKRSGRRSTRRRG